MGGGKVIEIANKAQWDKVLAEAGDKAVIVDFSAVWCGPCQMIGPYFATLSEQFDAVFIKVDVDANSEISEAAGISAMPTFQVYKGGVKVDEFIGASKDKLKALCEKHSA